MPLTRVIFFKDEAGHAPVLAWLQDLGEKMPKLGQIAGRKSFS